MAITELQRAKRATTLGASDIPTIFGANPWKSPTDLWLEKTGRVEAPDAGEAAEIGDALEAGIKPLAERRIGHKLVKPTGTFMHANGVMSANVDLMVIKAARGQPICEIKTTGRADEWADGQIPARVLLQVCAQMACAGSSQAHIAALVARFGLSMEMREVNAEAEVLDLIRTIEDKAAEWWERHITGDTEPDGAASADYISKRVRQAGKVVQLSADLIAGFLAAKAATKEAEMREDEAKTALLTALGDAEAGEAEGGYTVKFTKILTERFDSKGLRSAHPDIAAKFVTESSYRRLTVKGGKA